MHNLDWNPAKGPGTGSFLGQVDFKISAVVIEVLRLHVHGKYRGERGNIRCSSRMLSVSQAKICPRAQEALNIYLQRGLGTAHLDSGGLWEHWLWFGSSGSWNSSCKSAGQSRRGLSLCSLSFTSALARRQPLPVSWSGQLEKPFAALCHRESVSSFHPSNKHTASSNCSLSLLYSPD